MLAYGRIMFNKPREIFFLEYFLYLLESKQCQVTFSVKNLFILCIAQFILYTLRVQDYISDIYKGTNYSN